MLNLGTKKEKVINGDNRENKVTELEVECGAENAHPYGPLLRSMNGGSNVTKIRLIGVNFDRTIQCRIFNEHWYCSSEEGREKDL